MSGTENHFLTLPAMANSKIFNDPIHGHIEIRYLDYFYDTVLTDIINKVIYVVKLLTLHNIKGFVI